ncbi:MAG: HDOD domain-containing protein [Gammaproteobacteria bacterium]|nr:HDOD domain-containing protein [Gammaproteobacteria bacterium]
MLDLNDFVTKANRLYTLPDICLQLNSLVNDGKSSAEEVSRLVSIDPALTIRVLKLANTAIYLRNKQVETITEAVQLIGTDELNNIAIMTSAALIFKGINSNKLSLDNYWYHSVITAITAKLLYKAKFGKAGGHMFVVGLLHNIGVLIILERLPYFSIDFDRTFGCNRLMHGHEKSKLGFSFAQLGAALIELWDISPLMSNTIKFQNSPLRCLEYKQEALILHCGIIIADNTVEYCTCEPSDTFLTPKLVTELALDYSELDQVIADVIKLAPSVANIFKG